MENQTPNNKKGKIIFISVIVFLLGLVLILLFNLKKETRINNPELTESVVISETEEIPTANPEALKGAEAVIEGASLVSKDAKVITETGVVAKNDTIPASPDAPKLSAPLKVEDLKEDSIIKLSANRLAFSPNSFSVKAGQVLTLSLSSADSFMHSLAFESPELAAIVIAVAPRETRAITFNAPQAGEYIFFDNLNNSVKGKMIVK